MRTRQAPLAQYRSKRDFSRTAEPSGVRRKGRRRKADGLSFTVQRHAARSLHYDFRLERAPAAMSSRRRAGNGAGRTTRIGGKAQKDDTAGATVADVTISHDRELDGSSGFTKLDTATARRVLSRSAAG